MSNFRVKEEIFEKICRERDRQDALHGEDSLLHKDPLDPACYVVLGEEVGEVAEALLAVKFNSREHAMNDLVTELIQSGAVIMAWLEAIAEKQMRKTK